MVLVLEIEVIREGINLGEGDDVSIRYNGVEWFWNYFILFFFIKIKFVCIKYIYILYN